MIIALGTQFHVYLPWGQPGDLVGDFSVIVKPMEHYTALVLILETETDHLKNEPELS